MLAFSLAIALARDDGDSQTVRELPSAIVDVAGDASIDTPLAPKAR